MDPSLTHFIEFESVILKLDPESHDCRLKISELRRHMDEACDVGKISLIQWRVLLVRLGEMQARCVAAGKWAT